MPSSPNQNLQPNQPGRLASWWSLAVELAKFGTVGAVAFVVNWGLFNLLAVVPGGPLAPHPTRARIIASCLATVVAWLGNRYWTFRNQRSDQPAKELVGFGLVNLGGIAIEASVTWLAAWWLGFRTPLGLNLAFLVGTVLGSIFRYLMYKFTIFTKPTAAA